MEIEDVTSTYGEGYDDAINDILELIKKTDKENGWEENPVTKHRAILVLTLQERIRNELKGADLKEKE